MCDGIFSSVGHIFARVIRPILVILKAGGQTPLSLAVSSGDLALVQLLADHGVEINPVVPDDSFMGPDCETGLQAAVSKGCVDSVRLLLKLGANIHHRDVGFFHTQARARARMSARLVLLLRLTLRWKSTDTSRVSRHRIGRAHVYAVGGAALIFPFARLNCSGTTQRRMPGKRNCIYFQR